MKWQYLIDVTYGGCEHVADIADWLSRYCRGSWDVTTRDDSIVAMIDDYQDAVMFKLTWVGAQ